ncbi:MAG: DMT family transporter [archaeon]
MDISTGILFGIIAMISWGAADIFAAKASRTAGVFRTVFWSQAISAIIYLLVYPFMFKAPSISETTIILILITGLLSVVSYLAFYKGLEVGKVSIISPVVACWAAVTVILSLIFLNESLAYHQAIGVFFAILGAILSSFRLRDILKLKARKFETGIRYALFTMLGTAIIFILMDIIVAELGWFLPMFLIRAAAVFYLLAYAFTVKKDISFPKNSASFLAIIGILEVIGFLAYGIGITKEYTAIVAPVAASFPMVTIILARIFLKETLELNQKIGVVSVVCGLILLSL